VKKSLRFFLAMAVVLTVMTWTAGPASAAPSYSSQMSELNRHVNAYWMGQFLYNRAHRSSNGLGYMDWSTDGCSAPLGLGSGPYDFYNACLRHDFGYRNLKRIETQFRQDSWRWRNKANVDTIFARDMDDRCREFNWFSRQPCFVFADGYEGAVRAFGGGFPTQGAYFYSLSW
jgi:hypothetical protein